MVLEERLDVGVGRGRDCGLDTAEECRHVFQAIGAKRSDRHSNAGATGNERVGRKKSRLACKM